MPTVDQIQARLRAVIDRALQDRVLRAASGAPTDDESKPLLPDGIEALLLQRGAPTAEEQPIATCTELLQDEDAMPTLTDEIKTFIVNGLACYDTPSQVAEAVKANFGVEITRQHVYAYDPNAAQNMAPRWRDLHAATRQALLREQAEIGVAHRGVRLRILDRLAHRCERSSVALALRCLEMAAKECGGLYERRGPRAHQPSTVEATPPDPTLAPRTRERPAPQPQTVQAAPPPPKSERPAQPPESAAPQRPTPFLAVPLPLVPPPHTPPRSAPPPLAVLAQPPLPAPSPATPPLTRVERYLAYVRDRHARDRAVAAEARAGGTPTSTGESAPVSTAPPAT